MEEFLVTDFLINGGNGNDDIQLFDNEFNLDADYLNMDAQNTSTDSHSATGSPFEDLDVKMEDAPLDWTSVHDQANLISPIPRSASPTRVLATQSQVNVVVKVDGENVGSLSPSVQSTKKRRRDSDEDVFDAIPEELAAVFLKREQLVTISSVDHEAFVQRLANTRDLSEAELKEVKRQRRLIKNREYAQTSRQKKKATMGHVKDQVNSLESENDDLKAELAKLRTRVTELELENASLRVRLSSKDLTSSEDGSTDSVVDIAPRQKNGYFAKTNFSFRPAMAATSVLFVILFAFGFLFNSPLFSSLSLPGARNLGSVPHTGRALFEADQAYDQMIVDSQSVLPAVNNLASNLASALVPEAQNGTMNAGTCDEMSGCH